MKKRTFAVLTAAAVLTTTGVANADNSAATTTARVVRTDLSVTEEVPGSLGYDGSYTVLPPAGAAANAVQQAQQQLATDTQQQAADQTAVDDTNSGDAQSVAQQRSAVANAQQSAAYDQQQQAAAQQQQGQDTATENAANQQLAVDQQKLTADTAAQRAAQQQQLADQQQQALDQQTTQTDQQKETADAQQTASDQRTVSADTQQLAAAQRQETADQRQEATDCGSNSPQCPQDGTRVQNDSDAVSADHQQLSSDQATENADQAKQNTDQTTLSNDQNALTAIANRVNQDAKDVQSDGFLAQDDQTKVQQDTTAQSAAKQAVTQDQQTITQDQQKVAVSDPAGLAQAQGALAAAQLTATRNLHQAQAKVAVDQVMLQGAQDALAQLTKTSTTNASFYTWLPTLGQTITQGRPVYAADGAPVVLLYGSVPLYRDLQAGVADGPDIAEVTQDLITLGFGGGMAQGDHFSAATAAALARWEAALGEPATGTLNIGQAVVEPGAIRISALTATAGAPIGNQPVLTATSLTRIVTVPLAVGKQSLVHPGDAVTVVLPDQSTTPGHVRDVSTVAVAPSGNNNNSAPTVNVDVTLDHPDAAGKVDQAPVNVNISDASVHDVLAVPVNALLALAGGGDAVEVVANGSRHLVGVQTGVFSNTMVEISGTGIAEGTEVEVPAS